MFEDMQKPSKSTFNISKAFIWYKSLEKFFSDIKNIPYAVIKGEPLSIMAYGGIGYRNYGDIDILVSKKQMPELISMLLSNGFITKATNTDGNHRKLCREEKIMFYLSHQACPYIKGNIEIDINTDIFWGEYRGHRFDIEQVLRENTEKMNICGQDIYTLNDEIMFIMLCLHHYREMNAIYYLSFSNPFVLPHFRDVYFLFINRITNKMNNIISLCKSYGIEKYIYYVIFLTNQIFNDKFLNELLSKIWTDECENIVDFYGLSVDERKPWKTSFFDRLDKKEVFSIIEADLTDKDKKKIAASWSIYK